MYVEHSRFHAAHSVISKPAEAFREGSAIKNSCSASRRYLSTCSTKQLTLLTAHRHASCFSGKQEKMWQKTDKEGNSHKHRTVKVGQLKRVITQEPNEMLYGEINLRLAHEV